MALIAGVAAFAASLLTAVLSRLAVDDFRAWTPRIRQGLIDHAVLALPWAQQGRYREEWHSYVNDIPGEIAKLFACLGLLAASRRMSALLAKERKSQAMRSTPEFFRDPDGVHVIKGCTGPVVFDGEPVVIESGAVVCGDVQARSVEIRDDATVRGNVFARGHVTLREGSILVGDVLTRRISIDERCYLKGRVDIRYLPDEPSQPSHP
jgi:hypothetical protein